MKTKLLLTGFLLGCLFSFTNAGNPTIIFINAESEANQVKVEWKAFHQSNNVKFIVQRSVDGIFFENIATVISDDNNYFKNGTYRYLDTLNRYGISYYRIKSYTGDSVAFSETVYVKREYKDKELLLNIFPNPGNGSNLNIRITGKKDQQVMLYLYDLSGRILWSDDVVLEGNTTDFRPNLQYISAGNYIILAQYNNKLLQHKLIIDQSFTGRFVSK